MFDLLIFNYSELSFKPDQGSGLGHSLSLSLFSLFFFFFFFFFFYECYPLYPIAGLDSELPKFTKIL
jgi:hypothetical protein